MCVQVVSYNTLLKAYLRNNQIAKARGLLDEMHSVGIPANQVTYNEMLNALVSVKDRKGMSRPLPGPVSLEGGLHGACVRKTRTNR